MSKAAYPIQSRSDFKAWCLQERNAHVLMKEIIFRWRGSSAKLRGRPDKWAVYPRDRWMEWTGLSLDQVKRALKVLELDGMIQRERHRWAGTEVRAFIQPTGLALKYLGRPGDAIIDAPEPAPASAPTSAPINAPTGAPTDYTSLPSNPKNPTPSTNPKKGKILIRVSKGKGKASTVDTVHTVPPSPQQSPTPQSPPPHEPKYPKQAGPHEKSVWHPSDKHPGWPSWSAELKAKAQARYEEFVSNWYKGKKGSPI